MNLLTDKLPETVTINNAEVPINWDFRTSVRFADLMENRSGDDEVAYIEDALRLYYPTAEDFHTDDMEDALEQMLWFYRCGKPEPEEGSNKRILSFAQDSGLITAAFMEQYGIDFQIIDQVHWWKFKSLFDGMKEDVEIVKVMGFRGMNLNKVPKEQVSYYKKMQEIYQLDQKEEPLSKEERMMQEELTEALKNGGDVDAVLKKYNKE